MSDIHSRLAALGTGIPEILLPQKGTDLSKWAVIACDQFTQDRAYWEQVKNITDGAPSCLNLIFPEIFLEDGGLEGKNKRIHDIRNTMSSYLNEGIFAPPRRCCVYVERSNSLNPKRQGLILVVDLDKYDWNPGFRPLIRSTEGTVPERLPPRVDIRRGAPLELPHILILIDDEEDRLIPLLGEMAQKQAPLYETPLMMNSGAVSGWALDTEEAWTVLAAGLEKLMEKAVRSYGAPAPGESPFLFAVGDGNHSLATAKAVWDEFKTKPGGADIENHPARWALVEVENIYDSGIRFEPIHRVIFGTESCDLLDVLAVQKEIICHRDNAYENIIKIESASSDIVTVYLEPLLDKFVRENDLSIDYIHGEEEVLRLTSESDRQAVGLILPPVKKDGLFKTVARSGPLPRKSFSMGESWEKRFYLECRRLFG